VKRLTLMRHAHAQWKDPQTADFARPLNRRGTAEAEAMAHRLTELQLVPDLVIASPARRAQQTADIVARGLGLTARQVRQEETLYLAHAKDMLALVKSTGPRVPHLMIVAHNPGISELARLLAPTSGVAELSTAAACSITFDTDRWSSVAATAVKDVQKEAPHSKLFSLWG